MQLKREERGFTFVEILVVIALIALIGTISLLAFRNIYRASAARSATSEIVSALRDARSSTMGSTNDTVYGVRVGTSSVTRFVGGSYTPGAASNTVYAFEAGVTATGTLVRNGTNIVFARLTGEPNATGTLYVRDIDNRNTTTITIQATGLIE